MIGLLIVVGLLLVAGAAPLLVLAGPTLLLLVGLLHALVRVVAAVAVTAEPLPVRVALVVASVPPAAPVPAAVGVGPVALIRRPGARVVVSVSTVSPAIVSPAIVSPAIVSPAIVSPAIVSPIPAAASIVLVVVAPAALAAAAISRGGIASPAVSTAPAGGWLDPVRAHGAAALLGHRLLHEVLGVVALAVGSLDGDHAELAVGLVDGDPRAGLATNLAHVGAHLADDAAGESRVDVKRHANLVAAAAAAARGGGPLL